ncbi:MAG: hypothetical protein H0W75_06315 [Chitinophagaceae bacterium]|nr:hypothetical protein [Chitinophagaceae bacterium]
MATEKTLSSPQKKRYFFGCYLNNARRLQDGSEKHGEDFVHSSVPDL